MSCYHLKEKKDRKMREHFPIIVMLTVTAFAKKQ
jgi:hypothetical protein